MDDQTVQSACLWACPDCLAGSTSKTTPARPAGVLASRLGGISVALPVIGSEPSQILLPVVSAVLVRAQDMVLFLAFLV
jgi:aconitase A